VATGGEGGGATYRSGALAAASSPASPAVGGEADGHIHAGKTPKTGCRRVYDAALAAAPLASRDRRKGDTVVAMRLAGVHVLPASATPVESATLHEESLPCRGPT
jgi:hypothetical protein